MFWVVPEVRTRTSGWAWDLTLVRFKSTLSRLLTYFKKKKKIQMYFKHQKNSEKKLYYEPAIRVQNMWIFCHICPGFSVKERNVAERDNDALPPTLLRGHPSPVSISCKVFFFLSFLNTRYIILK